MTGRKGKKKTVLPKVPWFAIFSTSPYYCSISTQCGEADAGSEGGGHRRWDFQKGAASQASHSSSGPFSLTQ